jgi:hypothetical protein
MIATRDISLTFQTLMNAGSCPSCVAMEDAVMYWVHSTVSVQRVIFWQLMASIAGMWMNVMRWVYFKCLRIIVVNPCSVRGNINGLQNN